MITSPRSLNHFRNLCRCLNNDLMITTLNEIVNLDSVRVDYIRGSLWFPYFDVLASMGLDIPLEKYEAMQKELTPILDNSIRNYSCGPWISRDGLLHLLLFTKCEITDRFRFMFACNKYGHEPEYDDKDYYLQLPDLYQSKQFRERWMASYRFWIS
jgi:hypothetical protein